MKIYVITKGCYSDYHIVAVTTDPIVAEAIRISSSDNWDEAMIEEFENAAITTFPIWEVCFGPAGNVKCVRDVSENENVCEELNKVMGDDELRFQADVSVTVMAKSVEAAVKIAAEKRAECLAREAGIA